MPILTEISKSEKLYSLLCAFSTLLGKHWCYETHLQYRAEKELQMLDKVPGESYSTEPPEADACIRLSSIASPQHGPVRLQQIPLPDHTTYASLKQTLLL